MDRTLLYISTGSLQAGGTERVISILTSRFVKIGFNIKIFIWRSLPVFYDLPESIEIIDIPKSCKSNNILKCSLYFRKYLKANRPKILIGFSAPFNMLTLLSSMCLGIKTIVCERNDPRCVPFKLYQRTARNLLYYLADGILTQTTHNKAYFHGRLYRKTEVIYNPIFLDVQYRGAALTMPSIHTIVSVARLKKQKNQELLIRAFKTFRQSHPDYTLIIYGDGDYKERLKAMIESLNLEESVKLPGTTTHVFEEIIKADFFVLSSNFEGMPNTLIEAMCLGLPCVSTKVSGATDLIHDGVNGYLIDIGDEEQLVEKMCILADSPEKRMSIGKNATQLYERLNVDVISNQWLNYLKKIINEI